MVRNCTSYTVMEVEPSDWKSLLGQFPEHTVFHTLPWLETIQAVHGATPRLARADCDGRCVAIWPILATRKGPLRVLGSPLPGWSTAYMGPLFQSQAHVGGAIEAFLDHDLFRRYAYFACKVLNEQHQVDLAPHGFTNVLNFDTYCVDLTPPEEAVWDNFKSECRTRIRKARQLGLEVREEQDSSFIDEYWAMSLETFARCHIQPTFSRPFAEEMWQRLRRDGSIHALSAWKDGQRIAVLVLPFDNHTMYYWGGASYARFRDIPAHNLLHWEAMTRAQQMGLRRYDFVSTLGGAGRFKKTFGPQTITIATHWERSSSRLVGVLKDRYEKYLMRRQQIKV
jgi:CelD/BcsL family acetyltransferase involved in cellulose biosynthesis